MNHIEELTKMVQQLCQLGLHTCIATLQWTLSVNFMTNVGQVLNHMEELTKTVQQLCQLGLLT